MATRFIGTDSLDPVLPEVVIEATGLVTETTGDLRYWLQWTGTQAEYDALGDYEDNVLYVIID